MFIKPLVVFTTIHPWIQKVVTEVKPPELNVAFLDVTNEAKVADLLPRADALVCLKLKTEHARLLTRCKLVMHNGVGYDGIDRATLHNMGIPVAVTPEMTPEGVAEHVLMMILALYKQLPAVRESMQGGGWGMMGWRQNSHNLAYKTVGIVGLGRIGKKLAHLLHAFGCTVLYSDIAEMPAELEEKYSLQRVSLNELLERSDIVSVHVPLTDLTRNMFGKGEFGRMKPSALYINASRGETYLLNDLYVAVTSGQLAGAGIDVYNPEPPPTDHPIFQLANVICTPHIASGTVERQYAINTAQLANAQRVFDGLPCLHEVVFRPK